VKRSPTVEGVNGYLKVGSVSFNVNLVLCVLKVVQPVLHPMLICDIGLNERCLKLI